MKEDIITVATPLSSVRIPVIIILFTQHIKIQSAHMAVNKPFKAHKTTVPLKDLSPILITPWSTLETNHFYTADQDTSRPQKRNIH